MSDKISNFAALQLRTSTRITRAVDAEVVKALKGEISPEDSLTTLEYLKLAGEALSAADLYISREQLAGPKDLEESSD